MRKLLYVLGLLTIASMLLAACGGAAPANDNNGKPADPAYHAGQIVVCNNGHLTGEQSAHGNDGKTEVTLTDAQAQALNDAASNEKKDVEAGICTAPADDTTAPSSSDGTVVTDTNTNDSVNIPEGCHLNGAGKLVCPPGQVDGTVVTDTNTDDSVNIPEGCHLNGAGKLVCPPGQVDSTVVTDTTTNTTDTTTVPEGCHINGSGKLVCPGDN